LNEIHQVLVFPEDIYIMCANTNIAEAKNGSVFAATRESGPVGMRLSLWTGRYKVSHRG